MNENDIKKALYEYGFTQRESQIFLLLIKNTEMNVTQIVKETGIARTTVYLDLNNLKKLGFVSETKISSVSHFSLESLNKLVVKLNEKEEIIKNVLPFMKQMSSSTQKGSSIRIASGKAGIISVFEDIIDEYKMGLREAYGFTSFDMILRLLPRYFPSFLAKEASFAVDLKLIVNYDQQFKKDVPSNSRRGMRYVAKGEGLPGEMTIYDNKVVFFHVDKKDPHAIIIESKEAVEMQKKMFMLLWETLS